MTNVCFPSSMCPGHKFFLSQLNFRAENLERVPYTKFTFLGKFLLQDRFKKGRHVFLGDRDVKGGSVTQGDRFKKKGPQNKKKKSVCIVLFSLFFPPLLLLLLFILSPVIYLPGSCQEFKGFHHNQLSRICRNIYIILPHWDSYLWEGISLVTISSSLTKHATRALVAKRPYVPFEAAVDFR